MSGKQEENKDLNSSLDRLVACRKLDKEQREEINTINQKYRELKAAVRNGCKHEFNEWKMPANLEFQFDFMGQPIYYRKCKLCDFEEMKKGT